MGFLPKKVAKKNFLLLKSKSTPERFLTGKGIPGKILSSKKYLKLFFEIVFLIVGYLFLKNSLTFFLKKYFANAKFAVAPKVKLITQIIVP